MIEHNSEDDSFHLEFLKNIFIAGESSESGHSIYRKNYYLNHEEIFQKSFPKFFSIIDASLKYTLLSAYMQDHAPNTEDFSKLCEGFCDFIISTGDEFNIAQILKDLALAEWHFERVFRLPESSGQKTEGELGELTLRENIFCFQSSSHFSRLWSGEKFDLSQPSKKCHYLIYRHGEMRALLEVPQEIFQVLKLIKTPSMVPNKLGKRLKIQDFEQYPQSFQKALDWLLERSICYITH